MTTWRSICLHVARIAIAMCICIGLPGCIGLRLKELEIAQLKTESAGIQTTSDFLKPQPTLGTDYGGSVLVGGDVLNRFLAGLDNYEIPLDRPSGAKIVIESTRFEFKDGPPTVTVNASAEDKSKQIHVALKVRSDLLVSGDPNDSTMHVRLVVRDIVPNIKVSIFRFREFWFVMGLLRLEADKYSASLPDIIVPLQLDLPIDVRPPDSTKLEYDNGNGWMDTSLSMPNFSLGYRFTLLNVITLHDGLHAYFTMRRTQ